MKPISTTFDAHKPVAKDTGPVFRGTDVGANTSQKVGL